MERGARFLRGALESDGAAVVIVTAEHGQALVQRLESGGFDVNRAIQQGRYIFLDVGEFLSNVIVNGVPDLKRFSRVFGGVVKSALKARKTGHSRVAIVGEGSGLLCAQGNFDAAIQLETTGVDSGDCEGVDILCNYPQSAFEQKEGDSVYGEICAAHTAVFSDR